MYRALLIVIMFYLLALTATAQPAIVDSTKALYIKIQNIKPDTVRVKLIIHAANYVINKPGAGKSQLDSGLYLFNEGAALARKLNSRKWVNNCIAEAGGNLINKGDTLNGYARFRQVIACYHQLGDYMNEADTWNTYGNFLSGVSRKYVESIRCYQRALKLFNDHHQPSLSVHASVHISTTYYKMGRYELAIPALITDVKNAGITGRLSDKLDCEIHLAEYYWRKGVIQQSLYYNIESLKTARRLKDKRAIFLANWSLGSEYYNLKMYDKALPCMNEVYQDVWETRDQNSFHTSLMNVVHTRIMLHQTNGIIEFIEKGARHYPPTTNLQLTSVYEAYGLAYDAVGKTEEAEKYFLKAMALFDEAQKKHLYGDNLEIFIRSYNRAIGDFYLKAKKFEKARPYFQTVLKLPKNVITPNTEFEVHSALFKIDSAARNYISAIRHFQLKTQLHDSLFNANSVKQVAELNARYETDQRLKDIKLLKSQRDAQQLVAQKLTLQRNVTFGGIAGLLLVAGLSYAGYRNKKNLNSRLQAQQVKINQQNYSLQALVSEKEVLLVEKNWLLKEVHHRVKNNLQIIMSLLNSQSGYTENPVALDAIKIIRNRVQAISLIHQKLSNENNLATVNIKSYVAELVNYLSDGFGTNKKEIFFKQSIAPIDIDIAQAVSIALILNEAITNSIKYAFTEKGGEITLTLNPANDNTVLLVITDNGKGLNFDPKLFNATSLGFNIMKGLSAQLKGDFILENTPGVRISIKFPLKKAHSQ